MKKILWLILIANIVGCTPKLSAPLSKGKHELKIEETAEGASIKGVVRARETDEPLIFCNVALYKNGVLVTGTESDFDGNYQIHTIDSGIYTIEASYVSYAPTKVSTVEVREGNITWVNIWLEEKGEVSDGFGCYFFESPLVEQDNTTQGQIFTASQIRNFGRRGH